MAELAYSLFRSSLALYSRVDQRLSQALQVFRNGVEGLARHSFSPSEKTDITIRLYASRPSELGTGLWSWERDWFRQALPATGRILLGAAGSGREAEWLLEAGYGVDAFEPSTRAAAALVARMAGHGDVAVASYQQLIAAADGETTPLSPWLAREYAAVILGWGSLTHVIDPRDHRRLLAVCDRLAPSGPILASFWLRSGAAGQSRARALGAAIGRRIGRLRGVDAVVAEGELFRTHCGFAYEFTVDEIEAHAAALGRRAEWGQLGYPRVTLVKG